MIGHRVNRHRGPLLDRILGKAKAYVPATAGWTPIPAPIPGPLIVFDSGTSQPLPQALELELDGVRRKENLGRNVEEISFFVAVGGGLILGQIFLDLMFGLPWLARAVLLTADVFILKYLWQRMDEKISIPLLTDEQVAWRVEKHFKTLGGSLIGAVELAGGKPGTTQGSPGLLRSLIHEAAGKTAGIEMQNSISVAKAWQLGALAALVVGLGLFFALQNPSYSGILLQRLVLLNPASPSGTKVEQVTGDLFVQEGGVASLSAKALGSVPSSGHVLLVYSDGRREELPVTASAGSPDIFSVTIPGAQKSFRYKFFLHDSEGTEYQVKVEPPPSVLSLKRETGEAKKKAVEEAVVSGKIRWEQGTSLTLVMAATAPLKSASLNIESKGKKSSLPMEIEGFGRKVARVEIPESLADADHFSIELVGENNLKAAEQIVYSLERLDSARDSADAASRKTPPTTAASAQGLRAKDREDLLNLKSEPIPVEYTAMSRQYLKNISGEDTAP